MYDIVIRNGTVIDGLGNDPVAADVAVSNGRIAAVGKLQAGAKREIDADGLAVAPGFVDLHTHYDAQVTWDRTMSPSPSLGVTSAVMGNCGFGIVPGPPPVRDLILRNLSVVEGMDLESLRTGVNWQFESFGQYMEALRSIGPYLNVAVLAGHSVIRTAVMGDEASERERATAGELARMQALVGEAMDAGAIGLGSSYSLNHSGFGGVPMPSTITGLDELDALVGAMGEAGRGVVQLASGPRTVAELEPIAQRHQRAVFKATGVAMYNEREPDRAMGIFEDCRAARERGAPLYIQIPCQPLAFEFTMANAYPMYSHEAFAPIKAFSKDELMAVFRDPEFRRKLKANFANPPAGVIFQGNWERVVVAAPALDANAGLINRTIADIAHSEGADPLDVILDLSLSEDLRTGFIGQFLNVGDDGVAALLKHDSGVVALSDAGAHLIYFCDAGYGLNFLARWVRERGDFDLAQGIRRLTSHPADLYGIVDRGRVVPGAYADLLLFDPATVGVQPAYQRDDLPGGGRRTLRKPSGVHAVLVNGVEVFDGNDYVAHERGPGQVLDTFARSSALARTA